MHMTQIVFSPTGGTQKVVDILSNAMILLFLPFLAMPDVFLL